MNAGDTLFFEPLGEELVAVRSPGCTGCVGKGNPDYCEALPSCEDVISGLIFLRVTDAVTFKLTGELPHVPDHD